MACQSCQKRREALARMVATAKERAKALYAKVKGQPNG